MNKKIKLLAVFSLLLMFSCMAQPPQVINTANNQASPTPVFSESITPSIVSTNYPTDIPTLIPTNIPDNTNSDFMRVWSAVSGLNIADSRKTYGQAAHIFKGSTDVYNSYVDFYDHNKNSYDNTFGSSNSSVVSIDDKGNIKALNEGTAQITITSNQDPSISVKIDITVSTPVIPNPGQTGGTGNPNERSSFNGTVYDFYGKKVDEAIISAKVTEGKISWKGEDQVTVNGSYIFRNTPVGEIIQITARKEGWTTRTRYTLTKSNLGGDPSLFNEVDFGGPDNQLNAIQDEPQITSVKLNEQEIDSTGLYDTRFDLNYLELVNSAKRFLNQDSFQIQLEFSEPIDRISLQNSLKITSQKLKDNNGNIFIKDESENLLYNWGIDDRSVKVEINHKLELGSSNNPANYLVSFSDDGFKDKSGKFANRGKFIDFNNSPDNDFFVLMVTNPI